MPNLRLRYESRGRDFKVGITVRLEIKLKVWIKASVHKRVRGWLKAGSRKRICARESRGCEDSRKGRDASCRGKMFKTRDCYASQASRLRVIDLRIFGLT